MGFLLHVALPARVSAHAATQQEVLSTCFSHFKNLYFDNASRTFLAMGQEACLDASINRADRRGYSWKQLPHHSQFQRQLRKVPGTTVFVFEKRATPEHSAHFFHFLEQLLGIWNFGGEETRNDVHLFVMAGNGVDFLPHWKGANDVSYHLIKALFPNAEIQDWSEFVEKTRKEVICFENVLTADRSREKWKQEPYHTERMLGGYFQALNKKSLDHLASCVWDYCQVERAHSDKTVVTYIKRRDSRRLSRDCEKELLHKITELPHIELRIVDFALLPFKEQIRIVANTDVLLGVHGNGLSHTLFLPSTGSLIELFPPDSLRVEYSILTRARGLNYFGWVDQKGWVRETDAETLGSYGTIFVDSIHTDVDAIIQLVKSITKRVF
jgi:hypothetical protein